MKFGLIGAGGIGRVRKAAIEQTPEAEFSAVFDMNGAAAREIAEGAAVFDTADDLFKSDACEAVIVSTPTDTHEELTIGALESGKHVIVEKPMSNSVESCRRMVDAAEKAGKVLTIGFNQRYFESIKVMRDAVRSGAIGKLSYVRGFAGHTGLSEFKSKWMYDKDVMGGGALMDNGIHMLDLVHHIMGGADNVYGIALTDIWQLDRSEDTAFALIRNNNGVVGSLNASWTEWSGYKVLIEAYGDKGMVRASYGPMLSTIITMDKPGGHATTKRNFHLSTAIREKLKGWQTTAIQTFVEEQTDFINLAKGKDTGQVIATAEDGIKSIQIAHAVYEASQTGKSVDL